MIKEQKNHQRWGIKMIQIEEEINEMMIEAEEAEAIVTGEEEEAQDWSLNKIGMVTLEWR